MTSDVIPERWIQAARQGFIDAWRLMANALPEGAVDEYDGLALAATGLQFSGCNTVMAFRVPDDSADALQHAREFFADRQLPWVLFAAGNMADSLAPYAAAAGLRPSYPEPAMFLPPEAVRPPEPFPGFTIEVIDTPDALAIYRRTAASGFETDEQGFSIWASPALLGTPGLRFYLGRRDGEPVATSCVYALHGLATVNMVSVIPSQRRQGLGEQMTWKAVIDGLDMGCETAFLHASPMGHGVYRRMGFTEAFSYKTWSSSAPD